MYKSLAYFALGIFTGLTISDNWTKMKDVSDTVEMYFVK